MPKTSREAAVRVEDMGVMEGRCSELGGYTVGFKTSRVDADAAPILRGLPDDRCQSPHWGYVVRGRLTLRYADHDEEYVEGDAYFLPPGDVPTVTAGTEIVEFSPTEDMARTMEVMARNIPAASPAA
jgi:hypothetical protein